MNPLELAFGISVVAILLALGAFFAWRQVGLLRQLGRRNELADVDRGYLRGQALRRLAASVLMLVLAGMLIGSYFLDLERQRVIELAQQRPDPTALPTPEEKEFLRLFTGYWLVALGVLFLFATIALLDLLATLKYGIRKHRQLRDQHRALLEEEVRRLRQHRNGDR